MTSPLYWIATNAGKDGSVVVNKVGELPANHGFNAATLNFGDLVADGVIDPVKVTRSAVLNAASVARMVLSRASLTRPGPVAERPDYKGRTVARMVPNRGTTPSRPLSPRPLCPS